MRSLVLEGGDDAIHEVGTDLAIRREVFRCGERSAAEGGLMPFDGYLFGNYDRFAIVIDWRWRVGRGHGAGWFEGWRFMAQRMSSPTASQSAPSASASLG